MADEEQDQDQTQPEEQPAREDPQPRPDAEDAVGKAEGAAQEAAGEIEESGEAADDEAAAALAAAMAAVSMSQQDANDAVEQAMRDAMQEDPGAPSVAEREAAANRPDLSGASPLSLSDLAKSLGSGRSKETLDLLSDVQLNVRVELGRTRMYVEDILQLGSGAVVELDKLAGDPVDVFVNDRHVARGEVLVLNDNFCIRVNEILDPGEED